MKNKLKRWFDRAIEASTANMIGLLAGMTVFVVLMITLLIQTSDGMGKESFFPVLWNTLVTVINAFIPYSYEGSTAYIMYTALAALFGLLFTSVLIGIVGSAIEDKLAVLRYGNPVILEEGHTVILGFEPGSYTLIRQVIMASENKPRTIVVVSNLERPVLENYLANNLDCPKNTEIYCRRADITDPASLACCSIEKCSRVLINLKDDQKTLETVFAVLKVLEQHGNPDVRIITSIKSMDYMLPSRMKADRNIMMFRAGDIVAKTIAQSCTKTGIAEVFTSMFSFEGNEFYAGSYPEYTGRAYRDLLLSTDRAVPAGMIRNGKIILIPNEEEVLKEGDQLIYFAENRDCLMVTDSIPELRTANSKVKRIYDDDNLGIIGCNSVLASILEDVPARIRNIYIADAGEDDRGLCDGLKEQFPERNIVISDADVMKEDQLESFVKDLKHVVLLSDYSVEEEVSDVRVMMILMRLRDIRRRNGLSFSITVEMRSENRKRLAEEADSTEFIVASDMADMVQVQMMENPELYGFYKEILAKGGNSLLLHTAARMNLSQKELTVRDLRNHIYQKKMLLLGYQCEENGQKVLKMNPALNEEVILKDLDRLVMIGKDN